MPIKYFLYARKSSESEDKQMASNEDQVAEMQKYAKKMDLNIIEIFEEAQSAKAPGRPVFNEMLRRVQNREASGIVCWKLNRLARNPVDGGQISWMLQQNIIAHIQTYGRDYRPSDNVLMMQMELGMANQYIRDLSVDVRRGLRRKAERGWFPTQHLPLGYSHNPIKEKERLLEEVIIDKKRFPMAKKLWRLMLSGQYNIASMKRIGDKLGLRDQNGRYYSHNTYYRIFTNKFYCGYFEWKNDKGEVIEYKGKHKTMISLNEFNRVQYILGTLHVPTRVRTYNFPYRGLIQCGECQGHVTALRQLQVICTACKHKFSIKSKEDCPRCSANLNNMHNPSIIDKTYYYCTKNARPCTQGSITSETIEQSIVKEINKISIDPEFYRWGLSSLNALNESVNMSKTISQLKKRESEITNRVEGLIHLRADKAITAEQFDKLKRIAEAELLSITTRLEQLKTCNNNWQEKAKEYFDFALTASKRFQAQSDDAKRKVVSNLALNVTLKDKKLCISTRKVLWRIKDCHLAYLLKKNCFEPENTIEKYKVLSGYSPPISILREKLKAIRTCLIDTIESPDSQNNFKKVN